MNPHAHGLEWPGTCTQDASDVGESIEKEVTGYWRSDAMDRLGRARRGLLWSEGQDFRAITPLEVTELTVEVCMEMLDVECRIWRE